MAFNFLFLFQLRRKRNGDRDRHDDDDDFDNEDDEEEDTFEDDGNSEPQARGVVNRNTPDDQASEEEAYRMATRLFGPFDADHIKVSYYDKEGRIVRTTEIKDFRYTQTKKMTKEGKSYWIRSLREKIVKKLRNRRLKLQKLLNDPGKFMRAFMIKRIFPLLQKL